MLKYFFPFPLFISLSLWRIYRRIRFKWANNTFFKIYASVTESYLFLVIHGLPVNRAWIVPPLAIHRTNIRKEDLVSDGLELDFNHQENKSFQLRTQKMASFIYLFVCPFIPVFIVTATISHSMVGPETEHISIPREDLRRIERFKYFDWLVSHVLASNRILAKQICYVLGSPQWGSLGVAWWSVSTEEMVKEIHVLLGPKCHHNNLLYSIGNCISIL